MTQRRIPTAPATRRVFVNRTLNLRSIRAVGYDLDYTLVHYRVDEWEGRAFAHAKARLAADGWPVDDLVFDMSQVIRGLAIDVELGNLLKATRFGYVIRGVHGARVLDYSELRTMYADTLVDLAEDRFQFMNTLFSLSETSLYTQLVDRLDAGVLPGGTSYRDLYRAVAEAINRSHLEGDLKAEIIADPDRFIVLDPDIALALVDQSRAGKRLLLVTNSEWSYADRIMAHAIDPFLPAGTTWRGLFDTIIVSAGKPAFFTSTNRLFKIVDEANTLLVPHEGVIEQEGVFFGGNARLVEQSLGISGDEILYVGDHIFGDVHFSKAQLRWRTAIILRELESEVEALEGYLLDQLELDARMSRKGALEAELAALRLAGQRIEMGYAPPAIDEEDPAGAQEHIRDQLALLDDEIAPLAIAAGRLRHPAWGLLMRAGSDKSLFANQVERHADVYTSRVSNMLYPGPYAMFRATRLDLPHDPHPPHEATERGDHRRDTGTPDSMT